MNRKGQYYFNCGKRHDNWHSHSCAWPRASRIHI